MHKTFTKNKLKFGDVVFIDGRADWNIIGKMIRFIERGGEHPYDRFVPNHVGIILEPHDDIHECKVIQSAFTGVKITQLKYWTKHPKSNAIIKRCNRPQLERRKRILKRWLLKQVGKKYDYPALIGIFVRFILLNITKNKLIRILLEHMKNPLASRIKFTCSELVARAFFEAVGIWIFKDIHPANITPYDEYRSKKLKTVAKIINFDYKW